MYRTNQPSLWLPQHQHINSKRKTFKLIHKQPELELKPIGVFQCILFVNNPCHKKWILFPLYPAKIRAPPIDGDRFFPKGVLGFN